MDEDDVESMCAEIRRYVHVLIDYPSPPFRTQVGFIRNPVSEKNDQRDQIPKDLRHN